MNEFINFLNETAQSGEEYVPTECGNIQCWHNNNLVYVSEMSDEKRQEIENANYNDYPNIELDWQMA